MNNRPTVYLAGKMSGILPEIANKWRLEAVELLKENFKIINPCDYYNFEMDRSTYTDLEVKKFDLWAVENSDIILVNFDFPDSIGTAIELHMAYEIWDKPVIAYGGLHVEVHPWMKLSVTKWCNTLEDAIDHINKYYLPNL